ncbi:rhomboid family intramembrane serine protease [Gulosibacter sp. 10]|uniref:rhomboid family intramembrane serine protease n=1 Tax=Gulosibacter sp. 10 TaxID=1255570 RepID=UPI00097F5A32|nr:rhomboid family intramembrane serine protease [Gulosibacter sp. 10]SJM63095.1 rhomboid family serine protease [Gulosibacter sp. 10]
MTTPTGSRRNADDYCYRHKKRESYTLCQRCHRTICPECQTQAPVGVICPECLAKGQAKFKAQRPRRSIRSRFIGADSPVTYTLIGLLVVVGLLDWLTGIGGRSVIFQLAAYSPQYTDLQHVTATGATAFEPWRMLTSAFLHGGIMHFVMNALTLWIFGRALEPLLGSLRFLVLYLVSALGGSLAVAVLAPTTWVVGASGAIFGLIAAWFVVLRKQRQDVTPMLVLIGINVVMALMNPGISWQAHLGGFIVGGICALLNFSDYGKSLRRTLGLWAQILIGALCVALPPLLGSLGVIGA